MRRHKSNVESLGHHVLDLWAREIQTQAHPFGNGRHNVEEYHVGWAEWEEELKAADDGSRV